MGIGAKLQSLLQWKQMSIKELSQEMDIPYNTLRNIIKRNSDGVHINTVWRLAQFFGIQMEYFANDELGINESLLTVETSELTKAERVLIHIYRNVDEPNRKNIMLTASNAWEAHKKSDSIPDMEIALEIDFLRKLT